MAEPVPSQAPLDTAARPPGLALRAYAWFVVAATFFLIVAGGQVTSTDSGDAVPTWPLPLEVPLAGGEFYELGHRAVAGAVGVLTVLLLAAVWIRRRMGVDVSRKALILAIVATVLVLIQAGLGGLRVLLGAELQTDESAAVTALGTVHTLTGQIFLCCNMAVAFYLQREPTPASLAGADPEVDRGLAKSANMATGAVFVQMLLGALLRLVRPGPSGILLLFHILGALVVAVVLCALLFRVLREPQRAGYARLPAQLVVFLLVGQIVLGFAAFFAVSSSERALPEVTWRTVVPTIHLAIGSLIFALVVWIHLAARRHLSAARRLEPATGGSAAT